GPRQVGKTTAVQQTSEGLALPVHRANADIAALRTGEWLNAEWEAARALAASSGGAVLFFVDEIQKVTDWSRWVKANWDQDTWDKRDVRVVLTGSSPLLMQQGLSESLAGRFEVVRMSHWTYAECRQAFGWDLDTFIFYGGYPGAATLLADPERWRSYVTDTIIEPTIGRDILLTTRIDKPALLRRVFGLACEYAGKELSYEKMVGQLQDAGNTVTVAHYLDVLGASGLVTGLQKYSGEALRRRRSTPKLAVYNTALVSALDPRGLASARADSAYWGHLVEAAIGARLLATALEHGGQVFYWRNRGREVDYVYLRDTRVTAIEVKSGGRMGVPAGLAAFREAFPGKDVATIVVGSGGVPLEEFMIADDLLL
ncbi:MAG: ATP-binding protein, partial [Actinomycetota bacterium]|nr:ATP-binding protein [Actinomycetota bacterium]